MRTRAISLEQAIAFMSSFNENNGSNPSNEKYIPGTCNMGREEIKRRKASGWAGLVLTVIAITLLLWFNAPHWMRLVVFIPAVMGATGFIQAYNKFCVYFGFGHMFNLGAVGKTDTIDQKEFRAKDRARAWQLLAYAFGTGLIITVIVYLLP